MICLNGQTLENKTCPHCKGTGCDFLLQETGLNPLSAKSFFFDPEYKKEPIKAKRPPFEAIYMQLAFEMSKRSTCNRLSVGTVITSTDFRKVISVGYNGNASGLPNSCDDSTAVGKCGCCHAEVNAAVNCDVPRYVDKIVFCTHLPCTNCAKVLINLGNVKQIYYGSDYRSKDSLILFETVKIPISKY